MLLRRSGRVVRLARLALAIVSLATIAVFDAPTISHPMLVGGVIGAYTVIAAGLLAVTWNDWWLDIGIARIEGAIDLAVAGLVVFGTGGFDSTFFVFGNVHIVGALIRWGWRESLIAAAAFLGVFFAASMASSIVDQAAALDATRLVARVGNTALLALLAVWIGPRRWGPPLPHDGRLAAGWMDDPAADVIDNVTRGLGSARAAVIWSSDGQIANLRMQTGRTTELDDERIVRSIDGCRSPQLFALARDRSVLPSDRLFQVGHRRHGVTCRDALAAIGIDEGLAVPFSGDGISGIVVVAGVPGLSVDDLALAADISTRASLAIGGAETGRREARARVTATNLETACNVHDTVIQSLSGTAFRLQALKNWIGQGKDAGSEIERLIKDLRAEQARARAFVGRLRADGGMGGVSDVTEIVRRAAARGARMWSIRCPVANRGGALMSAAWFAEEVGMLVTEAISNAARHGRAREVLIDLSHDSEWLNLTVDDDGVGFLAGDGPAPWTLNERIQRLGGHLTLNRGARTRVEMTLPIGGEE